MVSAHTYFADLSSSLFSFSTVMFLKHCGGNTIASAPDSHALSDGRCSKKIQNDSWRPTNLSRIAHIKGILSIKTWEQTKQEEADKAAMLTRSACGPADHATGASRAAGSHRIGKAEASQDVVDGAEWSSFHGHALSSYVDGGPGRQVVVVCAIVHTL
jgi:hypothetical protein